MMQITNRLRILTFNMGMKSVQEFTTSKENSSEKFHVVPRRGQVSTVSTTYQTPGCMCKEGTLN
jgi:hypothetical protein